MNIQELQSIDNSEDAIQAAIDWQVWMSEQSMYMSELVEWQHAFERLAREYDLSEEFKENGII